MFKIVGHRPTITDGVQGDDFRPYLRALKKIDYHGLIVIECRWENLKTQGADAYRSLSRQIVEIYGKQFIKLMNKT